MLKMLHLKFVLCLFYIFFQHVQGEEDSWDYSLARGNLDPKHWYLQYEHCAGKRQSPVAINCPHMVPDTSLRPLSFVNYNRPIRNLLVHNDGHTIKAEIPDSSGLHLRSESLPASYRLTQFHFHWGTASQGGSEHRINGRRWPLELHLVHVDEAIPANRTTIDKNGLVVVSILFDYKEDAEEGSVEAIDQLSRKFSSIINEGENVTVSEFVIANLLPRDHNRKYLRYSGSLTTPPCAEVVEWIILTHTKPVTQTILSRFRSTRQRIHTLQDENGREVSIRENDRPLQPLNDRPIRMTGDLGDLPPCFS